MLNSRLIPALGGSVAAALALILGAPLFGFSPARASNARSATVQKVFPSAVRIQIASAGEVVRSASGIAFARENGLTYILTNSHVVEPSREWKNPVEVRALPAGRTAPLIARVLDRGHVPDVDLALLEVQATLPVTQLAPDDSLELGDDLVVIGAPFGKGLSVAAGIVSQVEYEYPENAAAPRRPRSLKTDAAIGYGSSGGGVFDVPGGRLVGLVEGYRTARVAFGKETGGEGYAFDVPMPGETFVAPAAKIRHFLAEHGLARLAPSGPDGSATAAAAAAKPTPPTPRL